MTNFIITSTGTWQRVDDGYLAPAIICMSNETSEISDWNSDRKMIEDEIFQSIHVREVYADWFIKEHYDTSNLYLIENGTEIPSSNKDAVCYENGTIAGFLLTAEKNFEVKLERIY
jgi:hypothetical protein